MVVHHRGATGAEVEESLELSLNRADVVAEGLDVEQIALVGAPARVTHHAGRSADQHQRSMAVVLEAAQGQDAHEVADVEAVGGGIDAVIQGRRAREHLGELAPIGGVVHQAAGIEIVENGFGFGTHDAEP